MLTWLLLLVCALARPRVVSAQDSLYPGGCRIVGDDDQGVNVTCTCGQSVQQKVDSSLINHLTILGCTDNDQLTSDVITVSFALLERMPADSDFVLVRVRSVNISGVQLELSPAPVSRLPTGHPLERLHVEYSRMPRGLRSSALRTLPRLSHVSLLGVSATTFYSAALYDLPSLRWLTIADCEIGFIRVNAVSRTPQLRHLRIVRSQMHTVQGGAIVVDADEEGMDSSCDALPLDSHAVASFVFANNSVTTIALNAIRVGPVQRFVASGNNLRELYPGAFNITLRAACANQLQFTDNQLEDVRSEALFVNNEADEPALITLGGNVGTIAPLSPSFLGLRGPFEPSADGGEVPDVYECSCCDCQATQELVALALDDASDPLLRSLFSDALRSAECLGDKGSFLAFADGCAPERGLGRKLGLCHSLPLGGRRQDDLRVRAEYSVKRLGTAVEHAV
ncbi:uncharacterized protein LOC119094988 [Pollicipes pollicipes]|uniref:uncharacterized protein LOC119094988 n=1 Tax=Pollicipes pollicipes TaxID=41117 RepID=UPI0018851302|nr:uncharacterized protein LOC119094988 [Pollicipes pollicipes]